MEYNKNIFSIIQELYKLDRFTLLLDNNLLEDIEGEYVLFSSVLNLFSAKNGVSDLQKITNLTLDVQSGLLIGVERRVESITDNKKLGKEIRDIFGKNE